MTEFHSSTIYDEKLSDECKTFCHNKNKRFKNWTTPKATVRSELHNIVREKNEGKYSRNCTYTRWSYTPMYHSELRVSNDFKVAEFHQVGKLVRKIPAPSGLKWGHDLLGPYIKSKDGTEYHVSAEDLKHKQFVSNIKNKLSESRAQRLASKMAIKKNKYNESLYKKLKNKVTVTLQDSRAVGNCLEGAVSYMKGLGFDRAYIVSPYAKVPAKLLDDTNERVRAAINRAIERETLVCI